MTKTNDKIDYGKAFEDLKDKPKEPVINYGLKRLELTDTLTLTRDGKPILAIPDELAEDFIYLIVRAAAYDRFQNEGFDDIPPELFSKPGN